MSTEWQGHDLCVQQAETDEATYVAICIESFRRVGGHTRGIEPYLAGLVEQRGVQRGGASVGGGDD